MASKQLSFTPTDMQPDGKTLQTLTIFSMS